jgi:hypothetical protein
LKNGSTALSSATLSNGAAMLSVGAQAVGSHTFVAAYGGDPLHLPASSAPVSITVPVSSASCISSHPISVRRAISPIR